MSAKRQARREKKQQKRQSAEVYNITGEKYGELVAKEFKPKNEEQRKALNAINNHSIVALLGRVGSGKTYIAAARAAQLVLDPNTPYEKIIMVRPNVPLGPDIGSLPGDEFAKLKPYLEPIQDGVEQIVGKVGFQKMVNQGRIEFCAVQFLRGRNWRNCIVILDEPQNLKEEAVAVSLLRKAQDCKLIFCGDLKQTDMKNSGLHLLYKIHEQYSNAPHVIVEMESSVRSKETEYYATVFDEMGVKY